MTTKALALLEELKEEINQTPSSSPAIIRIGATEGLMQQIHIKANKQGFEQLLAEQIDILAELHTTKAEDLHAELAEEYSDKVWTIDIRTDINKPLAWEVEAKETFLERISYWLYGMIILFVLACTLVGLKTIFASLFQNI